MRLYSYWQNIKSRHFIIITNSVVKANLLKMVSAHYPLWDEVKFIDRDPHWYTRRVKEAIHKTST